MKTMKLLPLSLLTTLLCCAPGIQSHGQVIIWGTSSYGQANVPASATNVIALAAGDQHCIALRADGKAVSWGGNVFGQTNVPADLTNVVSIDAGSSHSLALRSDGSVVLLGRIIYGMGGPASATVSPAATNVAALALGSGAQHALVLRADGTVVDWGHQGPNDLTNIPPAAVNIVSVAAASYHALALRADGKAVAWGNNLDGSVYNTVPASATNLVAIACGFYGDLGLRPDGTVVAWKGASETYSAASLKTSGFTNIIDVARPFGDSLFGNDGILGLRRNGTLVSLNGTSPPANATNICAISPGSWCAMALVGSGPPVFPGMTLNRTVVRGANAYFHMTAVGALPMFYQWNCNGTNIPGATNTTLALTNVQPDIAGNYYTLTASNALDTATSGSMYLNETPLEVYATTTNLPALAGATVKFTATATGQGPFGYQWFFNGTNLLGMITNSLSLTNVQLEQAGAYTVAASNSYGSVTSSIVNLAVVPLLITTAPANQSVIAGSSPAFSVVASSLVPLGYQWQFNSTDLPGATNNSLTVTNVQVSQAGLYSVIVSNSYGSVTANATLTVQPFVFSTGGTNLLMTTNGFQLQVNGIFASQSMVIYASTDLLSWLPILTNPPATGSVRFLDTAATNWSQRFYRATEQ
jgi:hypothetical protein